MKSSESSVLDAYGVRPFWRGRIHLIAACIAIPAGVYLILNAQGLARWPLAVFGVSLFALYAVSATYHRYARTERAVLWFRRMDHSMIFVLIAGSYTPICLLVLPPAWGIPALVVVWAAALGGITMKMLRTPANGPTGGSWLYIVMGWASVAIIPVLVVNLSAIQLVLLAAGGVLYTVGAIVLWRRWPDPFPKSFGYHEVWHTMTIAAGSCHFLLMTSIA